MSISTLPAATGRKPRPTGIKFKIHRLFKILIDADDNDQNAQYR